MGGCAAAVTPLRYEKPGTTQVDFMKDRLDCIKQAQQPRSSAIVDGYGGVANSQTIVSRGIFGTCMGAKGYVVSKDGALVAPPDAMVKLVD
jgi:hypothetical protein